MEFFKKKPELLVILILLSVLVIALSFLISVKPIFFLVLAAFIISIVLLFKYEFVFFIFVLLFEFYSYPVYWFMDKIGFGNIGFVLYAKEALMVIAVIYILRNLKVLVERFKGIPVFQNPLLVFFLLIFWQVISAFFASKVYVSDELYRIFVAIITITFYQFLVSVYCVIYFIRKSESIDVLVQIEKLLLILLFPMLLFGMLELCTGYNPFKFFYLHRMLVEGDMVNELPSIESYYSSLGFGEFLGLDRIGSFKINPNSFGILLAMLLPVFLGKFFNKSIFIKTKIINLVFVLLSLVCLVGTLSRGAILAFVVGISFFLFFINYKNKVLKVLFPSLLLISCLIVMFTENPLSGRFIAEKESYYSRMAVASTILDAIGENPFFGFGFRNLSSYVASKIRFEYLVNAHNFWLDFLAGNGIPGLILVIFFQVVVFSFLVKAIMFFKNQNAPLYAKGISICSMFIVITIYGISGTASDDWLPFLIFFFLYYSSYLYSSRLRPSKKSSI